MKAMAKPIVVAAVCIGGAAWAEDAVEVASLTVKERLAAIEIINVTAHKEQNPAATADADARVAAILQAAEAFEAAEDDEPRG